MPYDPTIPEEELKNRVARDVFGSFGERALAAQIAPKVRQHGFLR